MALCERVLWSRRHSPSLLAVHLVKVTIKALHHHLHVVNQLCIQIQQ